jgi:uncharacterized membrane protein (UPF0127 family)
MPRLIVRALPALLAVVCTGCSPSEPNKLDSMEQADVNIQGHKFRVWVANTPAQREGGMMQVTAEQMAPLSDGTERGMIFVFPEQHRSPFWMKDTIIALDLAFIRADGTIVNIHSMAPLDTRGYYPKGPYRYVLEVRGNLFSRLKISSGDKVEIPETLLKDAK